jgi:hypothetical protein
MQPPSPNKLNIEELIWKNKSINKKGKTIQRTRVSLSSLKTRMVGMGQHNKRQVWKNYKLNEKKKLQLDPGALPRPKHIGLGCGSPSPRGWKWVRVCLRDPNTISFESIGSEKWIQVHCLNSSMLGLERTSKAKHVGLRYGSPSPWGCWVYA